LVKYKDREDGYCYIILALYIGIIILYVLTKKMHKYYCTCLLFIKLFTVVCFALFIGVLGPVLAQTGTVSGEVKTAYHEVPLRGANIIMVGAGIGATTDSTGIYTITNVLPGTYDLSVFYIGYTRTTITDVKVIPGLTTTINFELQEEVLKGEEITIVAERQLIKPDMSAYAVNLDAINLENLPITTIEDAIQLQAGIEPNLAIRGGNINSTSFIVDGINLREGRTNGPITGLSFTALEQIQVQTSGFDPAYGNVRSGLVQIVTKDPPKDHYSADVFLRKRPSQRLNFPGNWEAINDPGHDIDMTIGGPLSQRFGILRFLASYRQNIDPYLDTHHRDVRQDETFQVKLISNIKPYLKLTLTGLLVSQEGITDSISTVMQAGVPPYPWGFENDFFKREGLFKNASIGLSDINHRLLASTISRTLNSNTFYEIKINYLQSDYFLRPDIDQIIIDRDTSSVSVWSGRFDITNQINTNTQLKAGLEYIYSNYDISSQYNDAVDTRVMAIGSISNLIFGENIDYESPYRLHESWTATPQQGAAYVQSKMKYKQMTINLGARMDYFFAGGERTIFNDFDRFFTQQNSDMRNDSAETVSVEKQVALSPRMGISFPITDKTKFYFNYGYFRQMPQAQYLYRMQRKSFIANRSAITGLGDPNSPMPRTIAYEIGYEQILSDKFLLQVSGYSRSVDNQVSFQAFVSDEMVYTIAVPNNYNDVRGLEFTLSKVRGNWFRGFLNYTFMAFSSGNFGMTGTIQNPLDEGEYYNVTQDHYQNKAVAQPYSRFNLEFLLPEKFGPEYFGYRPLSHWRMDLLGQWRAGKVFTWSGPIIDQVEDKNGVQYIPHPTIRNNVQTKDFYSLDLRFIKKFKTKLGSIQLFIDVNNLLNLKFMYFEHPFVISGDNPLSDYNDYMASLHLSASAFDDVAFNEYYYPFIPGNDQPGDYPQQGVKYVPIYLVRGNYLLPPALVMESRDPNELYYVFNSATYLQFIDGEWEDADPELVRRVLDNKAYINMPDKIQSAFLNPRSVTLGMRITF